MNHQIVAISWDHHKTPINFRDTISLNWTEQQHFLDFSLENNTTIEIVALSTCNRIEFYALADSSASMLIAIKKFYSNVLKRNIPWHQSAPKIYYCIDAVQHLCRVSAGMESMVRGERQILSQVKEVREMLIRNQPDTDVISKLFIDAISCAETVHNDTQIFSGPTSISDLTIITAKKIFNDLDKRKVLIYGAGETAELTACCFKTSGIKKIIIANRSEKNGRELAKYISADFIKMCDLNDFNKFKMCDLDKFNKFYQIITILTRKQKKVIETLQQERDEPVVKV